MLKQFSDTARTEQESIQWIGLQAFSGGKVSAAQTKKKWLMAWIAVTKIGWICSRTPIGDYCTDCLFGLQPEDIITRNGNGDQTDPYSTTT